MNKNSKKIIQASTGVAVAAAISILSIAPAHADEAPIDGTVIEQFDATPAEAPVVEESVVVEETPVEEVPAVEEVTVVEETPVEEAPLADEAPAMQSLVADAPVEAPAAEETPVETPVETPADEAPVEEAPADEAPVEENTPADEAPAEEDAPAEESPVEEDVVVPSTPTVTADQDGWYGITVGWGGDLESTELFKITLTNAFTGESQEITSSDAGTHTFTELAAGATYNVAVVAQNSAGVSEAATSTVELAVGTPAEPTINKARYNFDGISYTSYDFQVDGSDATGAVEGYRVTVTNAELGYSQSVELGAEGGRPLFTGLVPATTYQISATAFGPGGETTVNDRFISLIAMPANNPGVSGVESTSDTVTLTVDGATATPALGLPEAGLEVTSYDVTLEGAGTSSTQTITEPGAVTFSGLQAETDYTLTVVANNIAGAGEATVQSVSTKAAEAENTPTVPGDEDSQETENQDTENQETENDGTTPGDTGLRDDTVPGENVTPEENNAGNEDDSTRTVPTENGNGNAKATPEQTQNNENALVPTGGSTSGTTGILGGALVALGAAFVALRRKIFGNA